MAETPPDRITQYSKYRGEPGMPPPEAFLAAAPLPLGAIPRAVAAAPKLATALGVGGILGMGTGEAGEASDFKWSDPNKERVDRLKKLDVEIEKEATRKTKSAPGTQKARLDSLTAEKDKLLESRASEYNDAFGRWQGERQKAREAAEAQRRLETSWFDMIPGSRSALTAAAPVASYVGGKWLGKRLPLPGAMAAGATGGAIEGFASQYYPTEMDASGLPSSSPAQQQAVQNLQDPAFWATRVAPATGGGVLAGAYGAFRGAMGRRPVLPPIRPPSGPSTPPANLSPMASYPTTPASSGTTAAASPPAPSSPPAVASYPAPVFDQKLNRGRGGWRDPTTGNFAKKPAE